MKLFVRFILLLPLFAGSFLQAQDSTATAIEDAQPDQLDVFKINLSQLAVNEARFLYEHQIGYTTSIEAGAGYIYPNRFWYERGGATLLTGGYGVYLGFRKYFDKKRYIYQPFFRPYASLSMFGRFTSFENEWLTFGSGPTDDTYQCELFSLNMQQYGFALRFGWQSRAGRLVLDLYTGIGMKVVPTLTTSHAINDSSRVCEYIPGVTEVRDIQSRNTDVEVLLNAGLQVGLRPNNRVRKFMEKEQKLEESEYEETPPQF